MGPVVDYVRRRPIVISVLLLVAVVVVGSILGGLRFITDPLPLPARLAQFWVVFNGVFMVVVAGLTYRRIRLGADWLTGQELWVLRGVVWLLVGGSLGYLSRLVTQDAQVSLGTPGLTLGTFCIAYAMLGTSERRESERALKEAVTKMREDGDGGTG